MKNKILNESIIATCKSCSKFIMQHKTITRHGLIVFLSKCLNIFNLSAASKLLLVFPRRYKLAGKGSKVNDIVENFCTEDETIKFMQQKSLDLKKHIGKDDIHRNSFGITQIVKNFIEFLNNG